MSIGRAIFIGLTSFFSGAGMYAFIFFGVWNYRLKKIIKEQEMEKVSNDEDMA